MTRKNKSTGKNGSSGHPVIGSSLLIYLHPRIIAIAFLGFSSGLPLALTASTLSVWLKEAGVSTEAIGFFAAVATPYALKFLWSPLMDGIRLPVLSKLLGRRRGWLIATQLALVASILLLGFSNPAHAPLLTAVFAFLVAVCSASQDIVIDAYRVELLKPEEQGAGAATVVFGYRIGMIVSSAGALYLASYMSWFATYAIMATLIGVGVITALVTPEPDAADATHHIFHAARLARILAWIRLHIIAPFADFMVRPQWLLLLFFILLYKFADAFMGMMTNPFLLDLGFTKEQIAAVVKLYGLAATIIGSFIGGSMVYRLGIVRSLWVCGIAHAVTNLMFVLLAKTGASTPLLALSITLENTTGGMGTAAFVAFISGLCNTQFTATQYALLSSLAAFGRTIFSTPAGWFAAKLGWAGFFTFAAALAIPGLFVLWLLDRRAAFMATSPRAAGTSG